jgi:Sigma-70, region 4
VPAQDHEKGPFQEEAAPALSGVGTPLFCEFLAFIAVVAFFLWLRAVAGHKLGDLDQHHLGARMRDARREVCLYQGSLPGATSAALAAQLLGHLTRPSEAAFRAERKIQLQTGINAMDPIDREVLALRHFEQLTVSETARVLDIKEKAAGMRWPVSFRWSPRAATCPLLSARPQPRPRIEISLLTSQSLVP